MLKRYFERIREPKRVVHYAARYEPGQSVSNLVKVACKVDAEAAVAEVPELHCLLVRFLHVTDHGRPYTDYEVVEAGHVLVYVERYDLLYTESAEQFEHDFEEEA